jgi:sec-independent protein translocase protein TatC
MVAAPVPEQTFWEHIADLKRYLVGGFVVYFLSFGLMLLVLPRMLSLLAASAGRLVFLSPLGPLIFQMRVAGFLALIVSLGPWAVLLLRYLSPALSPKQRRASWAILTTSTVLGVCALFITYQLVFPWSLAALKQTAMPGVELLLTADSFFDLFVLEALFMTLLAELPLGLTVLALWGWINPLGLGKHRIPIYLGLLVVVAIVTPTTDLVSLAVAMLPAAISLEAGLLSARFIHTHRARTASRPSTMEQ